jgi:DNA-binding FadR family transcriptional regulator
MPIQAVDSDRLYRKIARQLSELIANGEFVPGQCLPAERTLAEQLGVSRPSVREALIALEIAGKVVIKVGSGVFVTEPPPIAPIPESEEGEGPFELLRARRIVESETAACAAQEGTPAEIAAIEAAVLDHTTTGAVNSAAADRAFHLAIARATHNGPLYSVVQMLWDQGRGAIWKQLEKHFESSALQTVTLRDHRLILKAIAAHDPRAARNAMRTHLEHVEHNFGQAFAPDGASRKPQRVKKVSAGPRRPR